MNEIIYGDCIEVMKTMIPNSVDLIVTDPPFKMTKRGKSCRPNYMRNNMGENLFEGTLPNTKEWMRQCFNLLKDGSHFYVFTNTVSIQEYLNIAEECGFKLHNIITMIKDTKMPNRWYLKYTELILFFRKGYAKPINDLTSRDYIHVKTPTVKTGKLHISQKPIEVIQSLVQNSSNKGDLVLDIFGGSGTTAIACINIDRDYVIIDNNLEYINIITNRITNHENKRT